MLLTNHVPMSGTQAAHLYKVQRYPLSWEIRDEFYPYR